MQQVFVSLDTLKEIIKGQTREIIEQIKSLKKLEDSNEFDNSKEYFTIKEAAKYLCLSVSTLRKAKKNKKITPIKSGVRNIIFHRSELDSFYSGYRN